MLNPFIEICGCVNDGICSLDVPDPDTSPLVMACNCSEGIHKFIHVAIGFCGCHVCLSAKELPNNYMKLLL